MASSTPASYAIAAEELQKLGYRYIALGGMVPGAFAYLAVQAMQNWSRFTLVAGTVLMWNFAEWAEQLPTRQQSSWRSNAAGWSLRIALTCLLGLWIAALAGDRFYIHTGQPRHFAFREEPLAFAHDAAIFAGQPGLPDRALVYGLDQTGVYDFHNAPNCKPFVATLQKLIAGVLDRRLGTTRSSYQLRPASRRLRRIEEARLYRWQALNRLPPLRIGQRE